MNARKTVVGWGLLWMTAGMLQAGDFPTLQKTLDIPLSIASVVDANTTTLPEYILIQDLHRHPEAQANIAALILHASRHWGLTTAYIEGAYAGQPIQRHLSEKSLRSQLEEGILSGAEMAYAMVKPGELRLEGIEDPDVYKENVEAYQAAQDQQSQALQEINTARLLQETLDLSQRQLSSEQLDRLELLARLKLKPAEYARYIEERKSMQRSPALQEALKAAERFYQLANRRSEIFLEQSRLKPNGERKIFVVGGFHTTEMAEHLRTEGKSFVVLSPHVTRSGYEHLYAERMNETISALKLR